MIDVTLTHIDTDKLQSDLFVEKNHHARLELMLQALVVAWIAEHALCAIAWLLWG